MPYHWEKPVKDREELRPIIRSMGLGGHISWVLGVIFTVLGIIADAANVTLGLTSVSWFLLAIVTLVVGMPMWLSLLWARHLLGIEPKKEE